jgi:tRNA(fMet)-specific endonuclease VapC
LPSVIVDTSEWIQYFRVPNSPEGMEVRRLLEIEEVVMVGVVYAELLRGSRNQDQFHILEEQLGALPFLEMTKETWNSTGRILSELQRQGETIALPDAAIAAIALEHGLRVFSRDGHFQRVPGLEIHTIQ